VNLYTLLGAIYALSGSLFLIIRKVTYLQDMLEHNHTPDEDPNVVMNETPNPEWSALFFEFISFTQIAIGFTYIIESQFPNGAVLLAPIFILSFILIFVIWYLGFSIEASNYAIGKTTRPMLVFQREGGLYLYLLIAFFILIGWITIFGLLSGEIIISGINSHNFYLDLSMEIIPMMIGGTLIFTSLFLFNWVISKPLGRYPR
jgi:hypothetical protein